MTPVNYLEGNKTLTNNILLKNKRILQHNFNLLQFFLDCTNNVLLTHAESNNDVLIKCPHIPQYEIVHSGKRCLVWFHQHKVYQ